MYPKARGAHKTRKVWVAGFGNEYREDDAAGIILARKIHAFLAARDEVEALLCLEHQLLPELAEELDVDVAIFCDADTQIYEDGFFIREASPDFRLKGFNVHSMGPEWLLALADQVGRRPRKAILVTVSGERFDFSDTPTPVCLERVERAERAFRDYWAKIVCWNSIRRCGENGKFV